MKNYFKILNWLFHFFCHKWHIGHICFHYMIFKPVFEKIHQIHGYSCLSCHNSEDYDALKLADGSRVEFTEVMTLCAQCHGPETRDYEHGAHGGMNGFWDLTRGPRTKNNCVDCHNPHSPAFLPMQPTFKPRDRFLKKEGHHE